MNDYASTITTKDLYFSATLKTLGYELIETKRNGNGPAFFTFGSKNDDLKKIEQEYYINDIKVGARAFSVAWKSLRRVLETV